MKKILFFTLFCFFSYAQKEHISGFTAVGFTYKFNPKWYGYFELQGRSIASINQIDYNEVKAGAGYNLNSKNSVLLAYGQYTNFAHDKTSKIERRAWIQYVSNFNVNRLRFESRFRLEQRFIHIPNVGDDAMQRFRYRLNLILPINKPKVEKETFFVNAYDEPFINFESPVLGRNRIYGGFGYQATNTFGFNLGYLFQRDFSPNGNLNLHYIFASLNFVFAKKTHIEKVVKLPSSDVD